MFLSLGLLDMGMDKAATNLAPHVGTNEFMKDLAQMLFN